MQEVTGSIPVISTRKKHRTEMCGAFLVSAVLNSLRHGLRRDSSLGEGVLGIAVIFPAKVQSLRTRQLRPLRRSRASSPRGEPSRKAHCESIRCNEEASGSALGSPFGRAGFAKQRLRGRGRQDVQMSLPVAAPPVKDAFEHSAECDKRKIIKNLSAEYGQSEAETISNRPAHRGQTAKRLQICNP